MAHCEAMDVPIEKIYFYASDGASVVSSDRGGLAGLLRARSAVLTSTHCLAHREALGMKDAVEQSEWAQWFDDWLHAQRSTAPAVGLMSSSKSGLLLLKTAGNRPPIRLGLRLSDESRAAGRQAAAGALGVGGGERGK